MSKKLILFATAFFTLQAPALSLWAATYYVDGAQGDDTNACSAPAAAACKTIDGALDKVAEGDTVKIAPWASPYEENIGVPVGNLTIEGTGEIAGEVVVNQGLTNTVDNTLIRNLTILNQTERAVLNSGNMTLEKVVLTGYSKYCGGGITTQKAVRPRGFPQTDATTLTLINSKE